MYLNLLSLWLVIKICTKDRRLTLQERCDLHTHTLASDGSDSPEALVKMASQIGLKAVAVTDHDTIDGLCEAIAAGRRYGIEVIAGVELSVVAPKGNMHILGYFIDKSSESLIKTLKTVQEARKRRNPLIVERLNSMGIPVTMDMLERLSQGGQIGRPHFARALLELGAVKTVQEAFDRFLKRGASAYVPKSVLSPREAIDEIRKAKGIAALAHPFSLRCDSDEELREIAAELKGYGLSGMECYYSEHSRAFTDRLIDMCKGLDLVVTGGTDYHGKAKPYIRLGEGKGSLSIPYSCVEALRARWEASFA